jgi:glutaredoxin
MEIIKKVSLILGIVIVIGVAYSSISGYFVKTNNLDDFAKCLKSKGATMYGAEWCPHCQEQKKMFGDSFKYVNYVECPENQVLCEQMGVTGYPTWIINGVSYPGAQSLEKLKELTGCTVQG